VPKRAADLFGPFVGDDPSQVFAPASATYHAAVQGENVDPDWGPAAGDALRQYIRGLFGDRFEIPMADCRQDLCELQIANRPGGDSEADIRDLTDAMGKLTQQPWWNALGFDQQSGMTSYVADGRVIALWFFSRR